MTIPAGIVVGEESTIAAGRLLLIDPKGEIDEKELLAFYEEMIEPTFFSWLEARKTKQKEAVSADQGE